MATKFITLTGPCRWAQVFEDNRDMSGPKMPDGTPYNPDIRDVMEGQYSIFVGLNDSQFEALKDSGSQAPDYEKEEDGVHWVRFKRPHKRFTRAGELMDWACGAPKVTSAGGQWDFETDGAIGNDSTVEVTVAVYEAGRLVGTRLESILVVTHVPVEDKETDEVPF